MENYIVAIPSFKRSEKQPTAEYMARLGVPKERIYIFTQTMGDFKDYQKYNDIATVVLESADGIAKARNNILDSLVDESNVLMMDDDISRIGILEHKKLRPITDREELAKTFRTCFAMAQRAGAKLFGIYPVYNAFYMEKTISTKNTVNTVLGFPKGSGLRMDESWNAKEDIEMCGRILAHGDKIYRYNFLAPEAKHRTNVGGCSDIWKTEANRKAAAKLAETYPYIFAVRGKNENEVRMVLKDEKIKLEKRRT